MIRQLRMAWRLLAGRPGLAWLAVACIAVGIAARGAVSGAVAAVQANLAQQARQLLAADLEVSAGTPLDAATRAAVAAELPPGARIAETTALIAMAAGPQATALVELRGIDPAWPLAGSLVGEPADAPAALAGAAPAALVDPDLLPRLGLAVGGELRLGAGAFRIAGTITAEPGAGAERFRLGPHVYVARGALAAAGLAGNGVRARHRLLATLPDAGAADAVAKRLRTRLGLPADLAEDAGGAANAAPVAVRSASEAAAQGARAAQAAADLLRLVALLALALGALGVAALANGLMRLQADDLALLRVLGATRARAAGVFLLQSGLIGLGGGLIGALVGAGLAAAAAVVLQVAPVAPHAADIAAALALAVGAALAAAALPAAALAAMQPLAVLRGEPPPSAPRLAGVLILALAAIAAIAAAGIEARSWALGPAVAIGAMLAAGLVLLLARLVLPLIGRLRPRAFALRQGLADLARADRRAGSLAVALGVAAALGGTLLALQAAFAAELAPGRLAALPSFFVIDVQDDQREAFVAALAERHLAPNLRPLVRARLAAVGGSDVAAAPVGASAEAQQAAFFRRREQNLSWAAQPGPGEELVAGRWPRSGTEVALERRWAERLGVRLGDRIAFDVQGTRVEAGVVGLRRVDWWTGQPNFFVVFGPGALDGAPVQWVGSLPALERSARRDLAAALASRFPNVTLIDIAEVAVEGRRVLDRPAAGILAVTIAALLAALAVVAGTAAASARERRAEAALVRALGGRRATVASAIATEFAVTALVATAIGAGLGLLGGWLLATRQLGLEGTVPPVLIALVPGIATVATATALLAARQAWQAPPLAALRQEE